MSNIFRNQDWHLADGSANITWEKVPIAVLMDIRAELQKLNRVLACPNMLAIPRHLQRIATNTSKKRRKMKT